MWAKLSIQLKMTIIFSFCLIVLTVALIALTIINVRQNITTPMHEQINVFSGVSYLNRDLHSLTNEEIEELISNFPNDMLGNVRTDSENLQQQLNTSQLDFLYYSYWIAGLIIALGSIGSYLISGVIVRPIKELSNSVLEIESSKLDEPLPCSKNHDEISHLIDSFNSMLNKLSHSFESKQLFAQNASHELKTPLALIRADMEVLEMNDNPTMADYEEVFVEVKNSTERMIDLVEGMLAMGKTLTEKDMITIDIRDVFEDILNDLQAGILSKQLDIKIKGELSLKGDKTLLRQAFSNLVHNAVRYNVEGGSIRVILSLNQIAVNDTGIGIPPESIDQLFDPFYRVDNSRSKKLGGNGLGLAITKNILDSHQMSINVQSEVGKGTTTIIQI